jgi:hypothetical protein
MLLDVPARTTSDAMVIAELVREALDLPEKAQGRRVAKRLARYFSLMLMTDASRISGPQQYVCTVSTDQMEPGYEKGSRIIYERCGGELVLGVDYIFRSERRRNDTARWKNSRAPSGG